MGRTDHDTRTAHGTKLVPVYCNKDIFHYLAGQAKLRRAGSSAPVTRPRGQDTSTSIHINTNTKRDLHRSNTDHDTRTAHGTKLVPVYCNKDIFHYLAGQAKLRRAGSSAPVTRPRGQDTSTSIHINTNTKRDLHRSNTDHDTRTAHGTKLVPVYCNKDIFHYLAGQAKLRRAGSSAPVTRPRGQDTSTLIHINTNTKRDLHRSNTDHDTRTAHGTKLVPVYCNKDIFHYLAGQAKLRPAGSSAPVTRLRG